MFKMDIPPFALAWVLAFAPLATIVAVSRPWRQLAIQTHPVVEGNVTSADNCKALSHYLAEALPSLEGIVLRGYGEETEDVDEVFALLDGGQAVRLRSLRVVEARTLRPLNLANLGNLTTLELPGCTSFADNSFVLPHLAEVSIWGSWPNPAASAVLLVNSLRKLTISCVGVEVHPVALLEKISGLPNLMELRIGILSVQYIASLQLSRPEVLVGVSLNTSTRFFELPVLTAWLGRHTALRELTITHFRGGLPEVRAVIGSLGGSELKVLKMMHFTPDVMLEDRYFTKLVNLEELMYASNLGSVYDLRGLTNLRHLHVFSHRGRTGLRHLKVFGLPNLKSVKLSGGFFLRGPRGMPQRDFMRTVKEAGKSLIVELWLPEVNDEEDVAVVEPQQIKEAVEFCASVANELHITCTTLEAAQAVANSNVGSVLRSFVSDMLHGVNLSANFVEKMLTWTELERLEIDANLRKEDAARLVEMEKLEKLKIFVEGGYIVLRGSNCRELLMQHLEDIGFE